MTMPLMPLVHWIEAVSTYWASANCDCSGCNHYSEGYDGQDDVDRCEVLHAPTVPTHSPCNGVDGMPAAELNRYPRQGMADE